MAVRNCTTFRIIILIIIIILLIGYGLRYAMRRRSPQQFIYETDLARYANATWPRRRIPRLIHQTSRTHDVPSFWNATVHSVIEKNAGEFKHHLWSDADIDQFVRQYEPHFYWNTYITYPYHIQRVDSFRYVLMFHLGGIYIDMDNGCKRSFRDLLATLEALDPDSPHLAAFPATESSSVDIEFMVSTAGHPIHKQFISRLHLFNHYFLIPFWTVFVSTGPVYAAIQERLFTSSQEAVVRILDPGIYRPILIWREHGGTWFSRDAAILFYINDNHDRIFQYCIILTICLAVLLILIRLCKRKRQDFSTLLILVQPCHCPLLKNSLQRQTLTA